CRSGGIGRRARFRTWFPLREWRVEASLRDSAKQGGKDGLRNPLFLFPPRFGGIWGVGPGVRWGCGGGPCRGPPGTSPHPGGHPTPWLEQHPTWGRFKICFRWGGRQFKKTVKTTDRDEALAALKRVEENIDLAERGRLPLPPDADVATFFVSDGKLSQKPN